MRLNPIKMTFAMVAVTLAAVCVAQTPAQSSSRTVHSAAKPLLLEKSEGERRIWREPPPGEFILKVSPKNNGSRHLVFGTEDMVVGDEIPMHKHLGQDEIVYIEKGTAHVRVGDLERDLHAGGTVFIPAYTWVSIKNAGNENLRLVFVFSAPGFENLMRCESVLPNETPTPISSEEHRSCDHQGHVIYKDREDQK